LSLDKVALAIALKAGGGGATTSHNTLTGLTGGYGGVYDHLPIYNVDTPILTADKVNNRVGIGTATSTAKLTIRADTNDNTTDALRINNLSSVNLFKIDSAGNIFSNNNFSWTGRNNANTNNINLLLLNTANNIIVGEDTNLNNILIKAKETIQLYSNTLERLRINNLGNMLINTTIDLSSKLVIKGTTIDNTANTINLLNSSDVSLYKIDNTGTIYSKNNISWKGKHSGGVVDYNLIRWDSTNNLIVGDNTSSWNSLFLESWADMRFYVAGSERGRWTTTGNLILGGTADTTPVSRLVLRGTTADGSTNLIQGFNSGAVSILQIDTLGRFLSPTILSSLKIDDDTNNLVEVNATSFSLNEDNYPLTFGDDKDYSLGYYNVDNTFRISKGATLLTPRILITNDERIGIIQGTPTERLELYDLGQIGNSYIKINSQDEAGIKLVGNENSDWYIQKDNAGLFKIINTLDNGATLIERIVLNNTDILLKDNTNTRLEINTTTTKLFSPDLAKYLEVINTNINTQGNIIPTTDNTNDLGSLANKYKDLYLGNVMRVTDNFKIYSPTSIGRVVIDATGTKLVDPMGNNFISMINGKLWVGALIQPVSTNVYDIGTTSSRFKDLYLSNDIITTAPFNITDSTNNRLTISSSFSRLFSPDGTKYLSIANFYADVNLTLRPLIDDTNSLGTSAIRWKDLYLSGKLYNDNFIINIDTIDRFIVDTTKIKLISPDETEIIELNNTGLIITTNIIPTTDDLFSIGTDEKSVKDIFAKGTIKSGRLGILSPQAQTELLEVNTEPTTTELNAWMRLQANLDAGIKLCGDENKDWYIYKEDTGIFQIAKTIDNGATRDVRIKLDTTTSKVISPNLDNYLEVTDNSININAQLKLEATHVETTINLNIIQPALIESIESNLDTLINIERQGGLLNNVLKYTDALDVKNKLIITDKAVMGVGTHTPNASSILDLTSTEKGFLPPRMTTTQMDAIVTPTAGLIIYNSTTKNLYQYNGTKWIKLGGLSPVTISILSNITVEANSLYIIDNVAVATSIFTLPTTDLTAGDRIEFSTATSGFSDSTTYEITGNINGTPGESVIVNRSYSSFYFIYSDSTWVLSVLSQGY
jgi:hypothetical protein